jgi:hypothetical protein
MGSPQALVDGCDHRRRIRNFVKHRPVQRLLDLLQAGLVGGNLLGVVVVGNGKANAAATAARTAGG